MDAVQFYKEKEFKDTEIGKIPKDWEVVRLKDVTVSKDGIKRGPWGSMLKKEYFVSSGYKVYEQKHVILKRFDIGEYYITEEKFKELKSYEVKPGDILMTSAGTIGEIAIVPDNIERGIFNQALIRIRLKRDVIDNLFFVSLWRSNIIKRQLVSLSWGATQRNLASIQIIKDLLIPLPPLEEQRKIAEILSTIDKAIEKTNEIIARTERLKKGLMQELLTKGIGHKEFKDTEIGKIPKDWEVVRLGDVCNQRNEVVQPSGKGKYRFVGLEHINSGETRLHKYDLDIDVKSSKFRFYAGDILYGKLRPYLDKAVLVDFDGICSTDLLVITSKDKKKALAEFIIYIIHSKDFIQYAISTTSGTNHPRTSWKAISKFAFGLPSLEEQKKIAQILSTVDKKLEIEKKEKEKLERIKRGFMDLLLTGKVRVCL